MESGVKQDQLDMPLCNAIMRHISTSRLPLHTPGHKQGRLIPEILLQQWGETVFDWDLTEVGELDNLLYADGVIAEAEQLTAELYGSHDVVFSTQGSTAGVLAGLLALVKPGQKVLVPRNIHVSVLNGLALTGAVPLFMPVEIHNGVVCGVSRTVLEHMLEQHSDAAAVVLVHPSYDGIALDVVEAVSTAHRYGVAVLVDEAHGAHLCFHHKLPTSAVTAGADIVVHSAHKSLPALTGAAFIHINGLKVSSEEVRQALRLIHSTSPSYLILASLDACRRELALYGTQRLERLLKTVQELESFLSQLELVTRYKPEGEFGFDPTKVLLHIPAENPSFWSNYLQQYGIYVEKAEGQHLLLLFTMSDYDVDLTLLKRSLREVDDLLKEQPLQKNGYQVLPSPGRMLLTPREVLFAPSRWVPLHQAVGLAAARPVMCYPPGIPLIMPGEQITAEACSFCEESVARGLNLEGLQFEAGELQIRAIISV